jgi:hypothetical protein
MGGRTWAARRARGTAVLCTQEYDVVPAPRQLEREVCTVMHAQLAFGARSRIRDNGREAACEEGVAEDGSSRRCGHLDRLLDRAYTCPVRHPLLDRPRVSARATRVRPFSLRLSARGGTRGHQLAEDDVAELARAVLRADEPRGAKPPRREDHRTLRHEQLLLQRLPLWRSHGRVAAGLREVALEVE